VKTFILYRTKDMTNVSGVGIVAQGTEYDNGKVTLAWSGRNATTASFDSLDAVRETHCHHGYTELIIIDDVNITEAAPDFRIGITVSRQRLEDGGSVKTSWITTRKH